MSGASATSTNSISRSACTRKHGPIEVGMFEVRRVGAVVSLTLGTPHGEFLFLLPERRFVKRARGPEDANGHRWRSIEEIDAERNRLEEESTPVEIAPEPAAAPTLSPATNAIYVDTIGAQSRDPRRLSAETEQLYLAAFIEWKNSGGVSMRVIGQKHTLPINAWVQWCHKNRGKCELAWNESRPPVTKPNGKIL